MVMPAMDKDGNPLPQIEASAPMLVREGNVLVISGTVSRVSGTGSVKGHFDLVIDAPEGSGFADDVIPLSVIPDEVPPVGAGPSRYRIATGMIPPAGSTVSIVYTEDDRILALGSGGAPAAGSPAGAGGLSAPNQSSVRGVVPAVRAAPARPVAPTPSFGNGGRFGNQRVGSGSRR